MSLRDTKLWVALTLTVTSYQALPEQTDSSPNWTSIGQHVHTMGAAVSQELLISGEVCYGDVVKVPGFGLKVINDVMNKRHSKRLDIFVENHAAEVNVGTRKLIVEVIKSETRRCKK